MNAPDRTTARQLAQQSLARGDATGWFETLYAQADGNARHVPWADLCVNPGLAAWLAQRSLKPRQRALVVGCGLGDDAEELARLGCQVTAFDVSPSAIAWCQRRFLNSSVTYQVADVLAPQADWRQRFDLVVEVYTLQVLPPELRAQAATAIASCVAPGGTLLVVARGREPADDPGAMPWPLTRDEFEPFAAAGLQTLTFDDYFDDEQPPVRRFRVTIKRPE